MGSLFLFVMYGVWDWCKIVNSVGELILSYYFFLGTNIFGVLYGYNYLN